MRRTYVIKERRGCLSTCIIWTVGIFLVLSLIATIAEIVIPILLVVALVKGIKKFIKNRKEKHNVSKTE